MEIWNGIRIPIWFIRMEKTIEATPEPNERYQQILNNFHANKAIDPYYPDQNTFIKRQYDGAKEISAEATEKIFTDFMRSEETKKSW